MTEQTESQGRAARTLRLLRAEHSNTDEILFHRIFDTVAEVYELDVVHDEVLIERIAQVIDGKLG